MSITKFANIYHEKMFPKSKSTLLETDPEFIEFFDNFAFDEVINKVELEDRIRFISILAMTLGCQGIDEFKSLIPAAINMGVTPVEIKEIIYQGVAYLGISRVYPFLNVTNDVFKTLNITLPLNGQKTIDNTNRLEAGRDKQVEIFGDSMRLFYQSGDNLTTHINYWLTDNCFGDYYTRDGLDNNIRELVTFCYLAAQGGCEPQLISHVKANMRIGNSKEFLIKIVSQNIPFIGYPRSLNAINCIKKASEE